jgi:hypothetical protein
VKFALVMGAVSATDKPAVNCDDYDFETEVLAVTV